MTGHQIDSVESPAGLSPVTNSPIAACEGIAVSTQTTDYHDVLSFTDEIQSLVGETSKKFIPAPS
jgi:hypothetical protein